MLKQWGIHNEKISGYDRWYQSFYWEGAANDQRPLNSDGVQRGRPLGVT